MSHDQNMCKNEQSQNIDEQTNCQKCLQVSYFILIHFIKHNFISDYYLHVQKHIQYILIQYQSANF